MAIYVAPRQHLQGTLPNQLTRKNTGSFEQ